MRFIPEDKVQVAYEVTHPFKDTHGAPVHIGNPGMYGIHVQLTQACSQGIGQKLGVVHSLKKFHLPLES